MQIDASSYNAFPVPVKPDWRHGVVAIGNFDGVHTGHQVLLRRARAVADQDRCPFVVLTFDPHPRRFFQPQAAPFLIAQPAAKEARLLACGADGVITLPFTDGLSRLSANAFIMQVLEQGLAARHIVVGQNFVFGYGRQGHVETLLAHGFDVTALAPVSRADGTLYASTAVRQALLSGDMAEAADLLGHAWRVTGRVVTGDRRGRTLGFPTANIVWPDTILQPPFGVYAVTATRADGSTHQGVANIGLRPSVIHDATHPLLEVHLFDFDGDLYGQDLTVGFQRFIRAEQTFAGLEALTAQIARDSETAQAYFAAAV